MKFAAAGRELASRHRRADVVVSALLPALCAGCRDRDSPASRLSWSSNGEDGEVDETMLATD